jgi:hypothetical protein
MQAYVRPKNLRKNEETVYDLTKDGQRFLVNQYLKPEDVAPLTIVQNVFADLPK